MSDVLITAWSRVQVLPGPPKKHEGFGLRASFLLIHTVLCSSGCESLCAACHRPVCRLQGWYWAVRVRLLRLLSPRRYWDWTAGYTYKKAAEDIFPKWEKSSAVFVYRLYGGLLVVFMCDSCLSASKVFPDGRHKDIHIDRLCNMVVHPGIQCCLFIFGEGICSHSDDGMPAF